MAQRSVSDRDLDLILLLGTEVDDGVIVLERDCDNAIRVLKALAQQIERLAGKRLVYDNGRLITAFRVGPKQSGRLVRRGRRQRYDN